MAAICSLLSPYLLQNPTDRIRIPNPSAWIPKATCCSSSRASEPSVSFSITRWRRRKSWISAVTVEASPSVQDQEVARRLYVGNIPRTLGNDELARIFGEHGSVEKAEVMYDKYSGRSRRFAFVTMSTVEDANAAIEKLNDTEIGGRKIKVNVTEKPLSTVDSSMLQAEESKFVDSPHKVYVGNLAKTVTTDILRNFFSGKGKVLGTRVSRVPGASKSSGFGFVSFSSDEDVQTAISSFNNALLEGQKIRVNKA